MLIEHRAYTLKRGRLDKFWALQAARGFEVVAPIMERLIGYFATIGADHPVVVHLYRFDDYADWISRLHGLYNEPRVQDYLGAVRELMVRQDNMFLAPAPLDELNPLWSAGRDWLPGREAPITLTCETIVCEETVSLMPGSLPAYWLAWRTLLERNPDLPAAILGSFHTLVGRLSQVRHYTIGPLQELVSGLSSGAEFLAAIEPLTAEQGTRALRPAPISEMSPLVA